MKKTTLSFTLGFLFAAASFSGPGLAQTEAAKKILDRDAPYAKVDTLKLCVDYHDLKSEQERKAYIKELDFRSMLSVKDHELVPKHKVENSMTMCGMYMALGKPLKEGSRQLRPMVFKTVHVYPDRYYVSQSGMIVENYPRNIDDDTPPELIPDKPEVAESPTLKK